MNSGYGKVRQGNRTHRPGQQQETARKLKDLDSSKTATREKQNKNVLIQVLAIESNGNQVDTFRAGLRESQKEVKETMTHKEQVASK